MTNFDAGYYNIVNVLSKLNTNVSFKSKNKLSKGVRNKIKKSVVYKSTCSDCNMFY